MSDKTLVVAQLLGTLIPLGVKTYTEIRAANPSSNLPPIEDILKQADQNWQDVIDAAKKELGQT